MTVSLLPSPWPQNCCFPLCACSSISGVRRQMQNHFCTRSSSLLVLIWRRLKWICPLLNSAPESQRTLFWSSSPPLLLQGFHLKKLLKETEAYEIVMKMSEQTGLSEDKWIFKPFGRKQAEPPWRVGQRCDSLAWRSGALTGSRQRLRKCPGFNLHFSEFALGTSVSSCSVATPKSRKQFHSKGSPEGSEF